MFNQAFAFDQDLGWCLDEDVQLLDRERGYTAKMRSTTPRALRRRAAVRPRTTMAPASPTCAPSSRSPAPRPSARPAATPTYGPRHPTPRPSARARHGRRRPAGDRRRARPRHAALVAAQPTPDAQALGCADAATNAAA